MDEFKPIETQEAFDAAIKDRLERERAAVAQKYEGFDDYKAKAEKYDNEKSTFETELGNLRTELNDSKNALETEKQKAAKYESDSAKLRAAAKFGLPFELADKISGNTAEEIAADAEKLSKFFKRTSGAAPLFEQGEGNGKDDAWRETLKNLNKRREN